MSRNVVLFFTFFLVSFSHSEIFTAASTMVPARDLSAPYCLRPEENEQDSIVVALLCGVAEEAGMGSVDFWKTKIASVLGRAEAKGYPREMLLGLADGLKQNLVIGTLDADGLVAHFKNELAAIVQGGAREIIHMPPVPTEMLEMLTGAPFLNRMQRASLAFAFSDQIAMGLAPEVVLGLLKEQLVLLGRSEEKRKAIALDSRVYGLRSSTAVEPAVRVMIAPAAAVIADADRVAAVCALWTELKASTPEGFVLGEIPFPIEPIDPAVPSSTTEGTEEDDVDSGCSLCTKADGILYKNPCAACKDSGVKFCEACLLAAVFGFIKELRFECDGDLGPVHVIFSAQIPACCYCRTPYFDAATLPVLTTILTKNRIKIALVNRIAAVFTAHCRGIGKVGAQNFLGRLRESYEPFRGIVTHDATADKNLLPRRVIALQIAERHPGMIKALEVPCADWK